MSENKTAKTPADAEPVAYVHLEKWLAGQLWAEDAFNDIEIEGMTPVYTAPPKREWVGLTDEDEIAFEWERVTGHSIFDGDQREGRQMFLSPNEILEFAEAIEAKLRKKNMEVEE
jgi:hypothetical protein